MKLLLIFLFSIRLHGQLSISTVDPAAVANGTLNLAATGGTPPYVWSLSPGSVGTINSSTGEYTAPVQVTVKHQAAGCQVYPSSSIFSTKINNLPVHASNSTWMAVLSGTNRIVLAPAWGNNIVTNATPTFNAVTLYTPTADGTYPMEVFPKLKRQGGYYSHPQSGVDRHVSNVNRETCEFTELYNTYPEYSLGYTCPNGTCTANSAARYNGNLFKFQVGAGVDAAGLPLQPLTPKLEEFNQGVIRHPMRITLRNTQIKSDFIWPATSNASTPSGIIPYGAWFRLKSSFNISGYSAEAQIVLQAWKDYGFLVADGTDKPYEVSTDADISQNYLVFNAIGEIQTSGPQISDFEFIDVCVTPGSADCLKVSDSTAEVRYDNSYETPVNFAHACVTDSLTATSCKYIALQGVTIGTQYTAMTFQAGSSAVQLTSWVNGTANQSVTWSMSPSLGTLTSDGLYTPPATASLPSYTLFTATSVADTNAKVSIYVVIWPQGVIRIDNGRYTDYVGSEGTWFKEHGFDGGQGSRTNEATYWSGIPADAVLYHTLRYIYSNDLQFGWWLTPGNYKITLKWGLWANTSSSIYTNYGGNVPINDWVIAIDTNGTVVKSRYDVGKAQGVFNTSHDLEIPCWIQAGDNGRCYLAIRQIADKMTDPNKAWCEASGTIFALSPSACAPMIGAIRIEPDAGGARIEIDGDNSDITFSKTRQFNCVGWFIESTCTWQLLSGPGSINSSGLFSSPTSPPTSGSQSITIRATHSVNGSLTADLTFNFVFGTIVVTSTKNSIYRGQTVQFSASISDVDYSSFVSWARSGTQGSINSSGLYSAPGSVSPNEIITITATAIAVPSETGAKDLILAQLSPTLYGNSSSYNYTNSRLTDGAGIVWINDEVGGTDTAPADFPITYPVGTENQDLTFTNTVIHGPNCDANDATFRKQVYLSIRQDYYSRLPYWEYTASVPNGVYNVRLKFLAPNGNVGIYTQNISIQGALVWENFDVVSSAGGAFYCTDLETTALVTEGTLVIRFTPVGAAGVTTTLVSGFVITDLGPVTGRVVLINPSIKGNVVIK